MPAYGKCSLVEVPLYLPLYLSLLPLSSRFALIYCFSVMASQLLLFNALLKYSYNCNENVLKLCEHT